MGTSTGFRPSGPQWRQPTKDAQDATAPGALPSAVSKAVKSHMQARLSSPGMGDQYYGRGTSGSGPSGGAGSGRGGGRTFSTARSAARGLGAFISDVQSKGIREALQSRGLGHLADKPLAEVLDSVATTFLEQAGFVEEQDALSAAGRVFDKLQEDCNTLEEFEAKLQGLTDSQELSSVFTEFFRYVLVEDFMRHYSTQLQDKYSDSQISDLRDKVEGLLLGRLQFDLEYQDLTTVDWSSAEVEEIIESIQKDTYDICMEVNL